MQMNFLKKTVCLLFIGYPLLSFAQNSEEFKAIALHNLEAFRNPGKNWIIASDASADIAKPGNMLPVKGEGVVVNSLSETDRTHLVTKQEFGDLEVEVDFMMAKNSNSGVYLQGRYEIQLLDSWTALQVTPSDCGGIYQRWEPGRGGYEGTPPLMNVAKAPGLWQSLRIKFRAPRFNEQGEKITHARFEEVYLNGVLVQQQSAVTGPTRSAMFEDEKDTGPLMLQGDHGNVAFKNIRYRLLAPDDERSPKTQDHSLPQHPIVINPEAKPYLLRSFMNFGHKKLTHVISIGNPDQLNFSYDLAQGALFQAWRGNFLTTTPMWQGRGESQRAEPLGSVILLADAPSLAVLPQENTAWPDSVVFDSLQSFGYVLDKARAPTFTYAMHGIQVSDKISPHEQGEALLRELTVANPPADLFCRVAVAEVIEKLNDDLYAINDKSYYIRLDKGYKPMIRHTRNGQEMLVRYKKNHPLTYAILW